MKLKPRETLEELKEDRNTLLGLMSNPYADQFIFLSCNDKLKVIDEKIEKTTQMKTITFEQLLTDPKYREMTKRELHKIVDTVLSFNEFCKGLEYFKLENYLSGPLFNHLQKLKAESEKKAEPIEKIVNDEVKEGINKMFNYCSFDSLFEPNKYIKPEPSIQITDQKAREICAKYFNDCNPNEIKIV